MDAATDYYEVLLVHPDAPLEIIRSSYRTLMQSLRVHPDLGGDTRQAALVNEAYAVLSDPARRAEYDRLRRPADPREARPRAEPSETDTSEGRGQCLFCRTPYSLARTLHAEDLCVRCASPLFPAARHRLENSGQRMLSRIRQHRSVLCYTSWPQRTGLQATMCDLSLNGMQLATSFTAEPGGIVKLDSEFCRALARVAYCRPGNKRGWVLGVEFITLVFASARGNFVSARA
jgi:hypothetical protein